MGFNTKSKFSKLLDYYGLDKLFINSGSIFVRRVIGLLLSFLWVFIITNLFGSETYGLVALAQVMISLCAMIFGLGIDTALVKIGASDNHYSEGTLKSDFLKKALVITILSSLLCSLLLFVFRDSIAENIFKNAEFSNYLVVISYFIFLFIMHKTTAAFLSVKGEFAKYGNYYFFFPNLLIIVFVIIIYLLQLPYYYLILAYLLSYGVFAIAMLFSLLSIPKHIKEKISYQHFLKLSTPMMISSSFLFVSNWTDTFMLGAMVSKSELGIYNVAFKLASLALIIIATVNTVLAPRISKFYSRNNIEAIELEVKKATKIITYLALPLVVFLILFRKLILGFFGDEFVLGETTLLIISIGMLFNAMSGSVGQILNMTNHQKQFRNFTIASAILNIILNYLLIVRYGIEGAAIASLISNVILNSMCIMYIKNKLGFYSFFKF